MYSSSTWLGLKSPEMPAKRYTSVSPTVLRTLTVLPSVRAAIAVAASVRAVIIVPASWMADVVHPAPVHGEDLRGDNPGLGRRQERDRVRDILGLSVPANHRPRRQRLEVGLGAPRPGHVG